MYDVKIGVKSLEEASRLMVLLELNGFSHVSMTPAETFDQTYSRERASLNDSLGRFNEMILAALVRAEASDEKRGVTIDEIITNLKQLHGSKSIFQGRKEGVVSRTISMVASSVLGDKYGWVAYADSEPRRFWLTEKGIEHTGEVGVEEVRNA